MATRLEDEKHVLRRKSSGMPRSVALDGSSMKELLFFANHGESESFMRSAKGVEAVLYFPCRFEGWAASRDCGRFLVQQISSSVLK
ncbi:hypothetical protein SLEP1_g8727 [Rubroshorea leprosula]|uniref:Uncharacterized protein n=1 Tax=Rubroshorea leprosula TaxID=152421 RepID=A0AAV5IAJ7_9ROSI|nr:hypothetical protein SLEP1_g8727 [Rubroshorea leprosula]